MARGSQNPNSTQISTTRPSSGRDQSSPGSIRPSERVKGLILTSGTGPIRPSAEAQFHWTDRKLHVHVFTVVQGHLLARLLLLKAERAGAKFGSQENLLDALEKVRKATILRRPRISTRLEEVDPELSTLLPVLGISC